MIFRPLLRTRKKSVTRATNVFMDKEIKSFYEKPLTLNIPSHSVLTERTIRDVDALSTATTSEAKRNSMIRALHKHRKIKKEKMAKPHTMT